MPLANDVEMGTYHNGSIYPVHSCITSSLFIPERRGKYFLGRTLPRVGRLYPNAALGHVLCLRYDFEIRVGRSFQGTINFSRMLYHAAFSDGKKKKLVPLFTEEGSRGAPTLRIRSLQHMTVIHLQQRLAVLAEDIVSSETATEAQMDRVQKTLQEYGTR